MLYPDSAFIKYIASPMKIGVSTHLLYPGKSVMLKET